MQEFRGSFKECWLPTGDGRFRVCDWLLMVAPNRYRKMRSSPIECIERGSAWNHLMGRLEIAENDAVVAQMSKDWPDWPNPVGLQNDLFDEYLAWRIA